MNEHEWGKKLREEADDVLFEDMNFDERLKSQVRDRIRETSSPVPDQHERAGWRLIRRNKAYGLVLAASFLVVAAVSFNGWFAPNEEDTYLTGGLNDPTIYGAESGENVSTLMTDPSSISLDSTEEELGTLAAPGEAEGMNGAEAQELSSLDEASRLFADELLVPATVPEGYSIGSIAASGFDQEGVASRITIHYVSEHNSFVLTQDTDRSFQAGDFDEEAELDGTIGYFRLTASHTELHWTAGEIGLSLSSRLDREQMMQIANSIDHYEQ